MKVIDNFLDDDQFNIIQQYFLKDTFTWYLNDSIAHRREGLDQYQFTHLFFDVSRPSLTNWSNFLQPLLHKLKAKYIFRIKANCRPRTSQGVLSDYHTDMDLNQQTAIFYLNTKTVILSLKIIPYKTSLQSLTVSLPSMGVFNTVVALLQILTTV